MPRPNAVEQHPDALAIIDSLGTDEPVPHIAKRYGIDKQSLYRYRKSRIAPAAAVIGQAVERAGRNISKRVEDALNDYDMTRELVMQGGDIALKDRFALHALGKEMVPMLKLGLQLEQLALEQGNATPGEVATQLSEIVFRVIHELVEDRHLRRRITDALTSGLDRYIAENGSDTSIDTIPARD